MSVPLDLAELRAIVNAALDELERRSGPDIALPQDLYRADFRDALYRLDAAPDFLIGSHADELSFLRSALADPADIDRGLVVMLDYVAALLLGARHAALGQAVRA